MTIPEAVRQDYDAWYSFLESDVQFSLPDSEKHTKSHCARVLLFALLIADRMGLTRPERDALCAAAVFHDSRRQDDWLDVGTARGRRITTGSIARRTRSSSMKELTWSWPFTTGRMPWVRRCWRSRKMAFCCTLNTAALTGESLPREVKTGDEIISGCINMTGLLHIQTTKEFGESTVSKILDLVENASSRKSKSEDFISRFAKIYTPAVCYAALALAILPPLVRMFGMGLDAGWETWIYRALTFLVASCPCALVISIPLSFFAGIGGASKAGVLVKGSNYLETLSQTKIVVFDKTGTLTRGVFEVNAIHHNEMDKRKLVEYAALAESASSHPISKSLQKAYGMEIDRSRVTDIQEISGNGVIATVDGHQVAAGNDKLMDRLGVRAIPCHSVGTIIHMAIDGKYAGHIVISDIVKPHSKDAIQALKAAGVHKTVMLTGDAKKVADQVAAALGLDDVYSELLPANKVEKVEDLIRIKPDKAKLAFVGDGINDAPVLRRADIGIAMGAMGSDAAIEAADVVLMDDDPMQISKAIKISRKCLGIVYQNIVVAIGVKLACLVLVALGFANMWLAVFADVGVMIIAVLNAIRALFVKNL